MKQIFYFLTLFIITIIFYSCGTTRNNNQSEIIRNNNPSEDEVIITYFETGPEFIGGVDSLKSYIERNLIYPQKAIDSNIQGKVYTQFFIDTIGSISDIKILRGLSKECDEEAIRIIQSMPKWKPGHPPC